jgi:hypothetical protein
MKNGLPMKIHPRVQKKGFCEDYLKHTQIW